MSCREDVLDAVALVLDPIAWALFTSIAAIAVFTTPMLTWYLLVLMAVLAGVDIYLDNRRQRALFPRGKEEQGA